MTKGRILNTKTLKVRMGSGSGKSRVLRGPEREGVTGLSSEAIQKMDQLDASSRRAAQRLGTLRVC